MPDEEDDFDFAEPFTRFKVELKAPLKEEARKQARGEASRETTEPGTKAVSVIREGMGLLCGAFDPNMVPVEHR